MRKITDFEKMSDHRLEAWISEYIMDDIQYELASHPYEENNGEPYTRIGYPSTLLETEKLYQRYKDDSAWSLGVYPVSPVYYARDIGCAMEALDKSKLNIQITKTGAGYFINSMGGYKQSTYDFNELPRKICIVLALGYTALKEIK